MHGSTNESSFLPPQYLLHKFKTALREITLYLHAFPKQENNRVVVDRMGLFYEHFTFGQSETYKKNIAQNMYPMICFHSLPLLIFFFCTAGNQIVYWNEKEFIIIGRL